VQTTVGQLLVNEALPADLRDHGRVMDVKTVTALLRQLAEKGPEAFRDVNQKLHLLGAETATWHGGSASISLAALRLPKEVQKLREKMRQEVEAVLAAPGDAKQKNQQIVETLSKYIAPLEKLNYEEGVKSGNPFALQILSGARGKANQFRSLVAGDLLLVDHRDNPVPIPVINSYAEGVTPAEYWASAYGARKGSISVKFAVPKSGYLGKQLIFAGHRMVVTEKDCGTGNGIKVAASDNANEGAVLARDSGEHKAGTVLHPSLLKRLGEQDIWVRSPITCQASQGVCQKCAGIRERGGFSPIGDNIGIAAAQAIAEPLSQSMLGVKHGGGLAGSKSVASGFDLINQLVQVPKTFQGGAAIATNSGPIDAVKPAPQGGQYVVIGNAEHWVPQGFAVKVKQGDQVEAGDVLSEGIPNPALIAQYKGIGEGRRQFVDIMHKALRDSGITAHRRNVEVLARGLVNHVRITDTDGPANTVPDDIVEYDSMVRGYEPRYGFQLKAPKEATGLYLEEPMLHYSIGTRITPRVAKVLQGSNIPTVKVHADPPSFTPEMARAMETLAHSDDWMVRLSGLYGVRRSVLQAAHRGETSQEHTTSFIPSLAKGTEFGKDIGTKGVY